MAYELFGLSQKVPYLGIDCILKGIVHVVPVLRNRFNLFPINYIIKSPVRNVLPAPDGAAIGFVFISEV